MKDHLQSPISLAESSQDSDCLSYDPLADSCSSSRLESLCDSSWEVALSQHFKHEYGITKEAFLKERETVECCSYSSRNASSNSTPKLPKSPDSKAKSTHSAFMLSPIMHSRRVVDRILDSYNENDLSSPAISQKRAAAGLRFNDSHRQCGSGDGDIAERSRCGAEYDWSQSPLVQVAVDGEDDSLTSQMDVLCKKIEQV